MLASKCIMRGVPREGRAGDLQEDVCEETLLEGDMLKAKMMAQDANAEQSLKDNVYLYRSVDEDMLQALAVYEGEEESVGSKRK